MAKLKSEILTEQILNILEDVRKLEKRYKNFRYFPALKSHLSHACKLLHELTTIEKSGNNEFNI